MRFSAALAWLVPVCASTTLRPGQPLRILPLGDSITRGFKSPDGNGYRLRLWDNLHGTAQVAMAGTQRAGNMTDNQNEGHNGWTISQVHAVARPALEQRPNVVLLHIGTNDLDVNPLDQPFNEAPSRLMDLVDTVYQVCPDTTLFLAKIINNGDDGVEPRIHAYNSQIPGIVNRYAGQGRKAFVVDMTSITADDLVDRVHPTEDAYLRMGDIWTDAIRLHADSITDPVDPAGSSETTFSTMSTLSSGTTMAAAATAGDLDSSASSTPSSSAPTLSTTSSFAPTLSTPSSSAPTSPTPTSPTPTSSPPSSSPPAQAASDSSATASTPTRFSALASIACVWLLARVL